MKILFLTFDLGGTASGVISYRIVKELIRKKYDVKIITCTNVTELSENVVICGNLLKESSFIFRLRRLILKKLGYSVYNSNYIWKIRVINKCKLLFNNWLPDLIYGRTTPIEPCEVGVKLARMYNIPVISHFTDPIPAPLEYLPKSNVRSHLLNRASSIISGSDLVSFGNQAMLSYQQSILENNFLEKAFISYDSASVNEMCKLSDACVNILNIVCYGSISGNTRNPTSFYLAVSDLLKTGLKIKVIVYSAPDISIVKKYPFVDFRGRSGYLLEALTEATILLDIDGDDMNPVYISSKLKDYLSVNRPILSITPVGSPSYMLLKGLKTIEVAVNEKDSIVRSIKRLVTRNFSDTDYSERDNLIKMFSPEEVVNNFITKVDMLLK